MPECYAVGQELAHSILLKGGNGIIYPSVRFKGGLCIACFRPALVFRPRLTTTHKVQLTVNGDKFDVKTSN